MAPTATAASTHHTVPDSDSSLDLPPISALFLIDFDVKAGYTIVWKKAVQGLELEGVVEYKSLPSGLHGVKDDLIYFIHEAGHAGVSAFINMPCEEEEARHARMIAVGILVPLSFGRLGRAWRHAEMLKDMAAKLAVDRKRTAMLEAYWERCKASSDGKSPTTRPNETPIASPTIALQQTLSNRSKGHSRNRSASDGGAIFHPGHSLSKYHPARSLNAMVDVFGPLIFPIHRAAMLRKRILISCQAPVHEMCNFVYGLSILSNIPQSVADFLPPQAPTHRLRPLFTIGVHDIPSLMQMSASNARRRQQSGEGDDDATLRGDDVSSGWIACTTDSILAMKDTLWDVLITMPPAFATNAQTKVWPTVEFPGRKPIRATQRDLRRFRALKGGLARLGAVATRPYHSSGTAHSQSSADVRPSTSDTTVVDDECDESLDKIVQPPTWAELAYGGFMWWASAGEQHRSYEHDEAVHDASLLADWAPPPTTPPAANAALPNPSHEPMTATIPSLNGDDGNEARVELAIIAFFHRLTTDILTVIGDATEADDTPYEDDDSDSGVGEARLLPADEEDRSRPARIDSTAFELMGLDVWNPSDAEFVTELANIYFERSVRIEGKGIEVCGLRVC
ncbi:hypothetical protein jhhlp_002026 [Lomentospora prolificans]|uniref:DUF4484 domain-containing protein n=1 Tax=Lomentospora prolificans TaxID=41688 RepID=A0A2N3NCV4_9PEZI|nr:hypothetical protein jhhlp_002026 [Lomentospora prolificans]